MIPAGLYIAVIVAVVFSLCLSRRRANTSVLPLPPGPPSLPFIGNAHQAPKSHAWLQYEQWGKAYGPVVHLNMAGQPVIVLSTFEAAHGLLNKQGAKFADRPRFVVAGEMASQGMHMLLRPYDARFKLHQKLQSPVLNERAANGYLRFQELESRQMLFDILETTARRDKEGFNCHGHMERTTASIIYSLLYGHRVWSADDPILINAHDVNHEFDQLAQVGKYLVDAFPVLNDLPLPRFLTPWKTEAADHWQRQRSLHMGNLERALQGNNSWNFSKQMQQMVITQSIDMPPDELALNIGIMADAALDASTGTMMWFVMACITTQDRGGWVAKAQALLDDAVGRQRLPTFEDRSNLPYIDAIVEELLRWRPAGAAGVPHFGKVESTYNGHRIPANSVVIPNHWAMTRDQDVYGPDVEDFRPERFLGGDKLPTIGFGFGRRICPGRHVARNNLWISISRLLWGFDIKPAPSEEGRLSNPTKGTDGLVTIPLPFKVRFEPRDQSTRDLIQRDCNTHAVDFASMLNQIGREVPKPSGDNY